MAKQQIALNVPPSVYTDNGDAREFWNNIFGPLLQNNVSSVERTSNSRFKIGKRFSFAWDNRFLNIYNNKNNRLLKIEYNKITSFQLTGIILPSGDVVEAIEINNDIYLRF